MFKCGSDEDEESNVNAVKYPCMPSLVALQQMRNRLHMAHLGKKLMKWTALATGRELRRIAKELTILYHTFREDLRNAFILIARARYFCPNLDKYVLENVPFQAALTVGTTTKSISGVKVIQFEAIESESDPYEHLGIDKGGQAISEVKTCWKNLTKSLVMILQLRVVFVQIEDAHTNANKKRNMLTKVIIPKTKASIKYILTELEEMEREEMFRLKRFKFAKEKRNNNKLIQVCCCCLKMLQPEAQAESLCPMCEKAVHVKRKVSVKKIEVLPCRSAELKANEYVKGLEQLMVNIDHVIGLTKQFKMEGILSSSIERFINTCSEVKLKIEDYANMAQACDMYQNSLQNSNSYASVQPSLKESCSATTPIETCRSCASEFVDLPMNENSYCETEHKEIVKIIITINEDGSVTEEKQIITIKTERKHPSTNTAAIEGEKRFVNNRDNLHIIGTRKTKSEDLKKNYKMIKPKARRCMSADNYYNPTQMDKGINFNSGVSVSVKTSRVTLPPDSDFSDVTLIKSTPSVSKTCSQSSSLYSNDTRSKISNNVSSYQDSTKSSSSCGGKLKSSLKQTASVDAIWRDQCTSTTDFDDFPIRTVKYSQSSPVSNIRQKCCEKDSFDSNLDRKKDKEPSGCCVIKIIPKSMGSNKSCSGSTKEHTCKDIVIKGGMLEALKQIMLPQRKSNTCGPNEITPENIICDSYGSKENSFVPAQKSCTSSTKSSKMCSASPDDQQEDFQSCHSYTSATTNMSSKNVSAKSSLSSVNSCCTHKNASRKSSKSKIECGSCVAHDPSSSKSFCCSNTKSTSTCCPLKSSEDSVKKPTCIDVKDATTCTKRSTRFDVRPLKKRVTSKKDLSCTCHSDSYMLRGRVGNRKPPRRSQSFYEDEYYFFRW